MNPPDPWPKALDIFVVDANVTDLGISHRYQLSVVRGIRENLLIAGHRSIKDDFAADLAGNAKTASLEHGPVGQYQSCLHSVSSHTERPPTSRARNLSLQGPAIEWRIVALRRRTRGLELPLALRIENRHIGDRSDGQRAAIQAEVGGRRPAHRIDQTIDADRLVAHQFERKRQRGFQTGDAKGRLIELDAFFVAVMGCVVSRDRIDRAIG